MSQATTYTSARDAIGKPDSATLRSETPFAIGSLALIWQILFFYLPLVLMVCSSIVKISSNGFITGLTLEHFIPILKPTYFSIIFSSVSLAMITAISTLIIGFPLAYFLALKCKKYQNVFLFLLVVPFWTNFLLHIYAWFFVLEREGFLNHLLMHLGLIDSPLHMLNTQFAVYLMMIYYYLPFMVLPIYSSLERLDPTLLEASLDLGANWGQTGRKILFPLTFKGIQAGFFLVFIPAFGEFAIPELMGGDKSYYVGNVVSQFILGEKTGPIGTAFTVLSALVLTGTIALVYLIMHVIKKKVVKRAPMESIC